MFAGNLIELDSESMPWHEAIPSVAFGDRYRGQGCAYGYVYAGPDDERDYLNVYIRIAEDLPVALNVECSEPGRYFVSVRRDDGAFRNVSGFYMWQVDALRALPIVKAEWMKKDPRACWYAWGTAKER